MLRFMCSLESRKVLLVKVISLNNLIYKMIQLSQRLQVGATIEPFHQMEDRSIQERCEIVGLQVLE